VALYSVTIIADSLEAAARLRGMDLDLHERAARRRSATGEIAVPAILDDDGIQRVQDAGYRVEIREDLDLVAAARATDVDATTNRLAPPRRSAGSDAANRAEDDVAEARRTLEAIVDPAEPEVARGAADSRSVLGGYLTAAEIESALQTLAAAYPADTSLIELPEKTWEERTTHALWIHAGAAEDRIGVLVTGGMHAREWGGSDICIAFATKLLKAYAAQMPLVYGGKSYTAAQVQAMLKRLDIFVFAAVNPDGKAFSQANDLAMGGSQGTWWRKNRNPNPGLSAKGVDLNRNFDFLWTSGIGTSTNAASFTYRGDSPFSEPEARNIRHLLDAHPQIGYFVDVHSFGELILFSWGDDENQSSNQAQNFKSAAFAGIRGIVGDTAYREFIAAADQTKLKGLAVAMNASLKKVRGKNYTVEQAVGLYPTSGTSDDYAFSRHYIDPALREVYSFTIEFGQEFVPPYTEMRRIIADVGSALTELCRRAADA
jgi:murein tripeptide amidase MpaA